jgi:IS30 family transposase
MRAPRAVASGPDAPLLAREPELRQLVKDKLKEKWSPAQDHGAHQRETYLDRPEWHLCQETMYQALYHGGEGGLHRTLTKKLRTGRPLRKRRRSP